MMHRPVKHRPAAGFTLVELLLAVTLMSILLGLTYSGLRAASRSTERGEELLAFAGGVRAGHQFVRRQLNQMLPLAFAEMDDLEKTRIVFAGDRENILFVGPMPGYLGTGGPQVQSLQLASGDDGFELQFRHALLQQFEDARLFDRDPVILLEGIESMEFEYMGRDLEGLLTGWTSSWGPTDIIPAAVRLNVVFSEDRNLQWPSLVAGVRVDASAVQGEARRPSVYQQKMRELISGKPTDDTR